ncbi:sigma-70 family RNA polymerase sigma factor [Pseudarthrobacter sp. J75]|uniref:RNA polymerase sigma factor n=1 Tax=unclassified Pseudarthrobacter TaxID=2647000 RepID=UPI002E818808|nr:MULTISPECIES: sigma-70 family RNA polymerase sigma factor [unclassified Pseudarthrobacter]MEE2522607.1 sigma-70 family RNA polymerase sigma factor [Pseudarthrobacter sp. J47]MEE2530720.1 sigma-70 family RNA polymerase sigma factor [Pseudarthrobacter sp. J75]MEE2571026.1 sigma-70 family RNA polymerase sigma factor [Pseudarthrobacter sp. J64]
MAEVLTDDVLRESNARDPRLFELVYRSFASQVLGYLAARGVEDPEALMQEVFLTVIPRIEGISGGVHGLRTFIFSVAHARMVDDHRRQQRRPLQVAFDVERDKREAASAEAVAMAGLIPAEVAQLMQVLLDDQREVLTLRIVAGLSVEQTAEIMGKSQGAVKQLQRRALEKLREQAAVKDYVTP